MTLSHDRNSDAEVEGIASVVDRFVKREIEPHLDAWEARGEAPVRSLLRRLAALGLIGVDLPSGMGGAGGDFRHAMAVAEALGHIPAQGLSAALAAHVERAVPWLALVGDSSERERWLSALVRGDAIACAPSDDVEDESDWVVGALDADVLVGRGGCIPLQGRTDILEPAPRQLGLWTAGLRRLNDATPVSARHSPDAAIAQRWGSRCRLLEAARSLRWMEDLVTRTREYTGQRLVFGAPLLARPAIRFRLAELQVEIDGLRALCRAGADEVTRGRDAGRLAEGALWKSVRLQHRVADDCLQCWGGMGFMADSPPARAWRDGIVAAIGRQSLLLESVARSIERETGTRA